jgi:hypothetical protein
MTIPKYYPTPMYDAARATPERSTTWPNGTPKLSGKHRLLAMTPLAFILAGGFGLYDVFAQASENHRSAEQLRANCPSGQLYEGTQGNVRVATTHTGVLPNDGLVVCMTTPKP